MTIENYEKLLDRYKLKSITDIIKFINFDALDYEENKDFLREITGIMHKGCNVFQWLDIDIVLYPYYGNFILKSKGMGKKLLDLLRNGYCTLKELDIKKIDIEYLQEFAWLFNIDLKIQKEIDGYYRAYLCGKRSFY